MLSATMRDYVARITGPNFHSLFRLFGDQRRQVDRWLGELTERAHAIGIMARFGVDEIARSARAVVTPRNPLPPRNMVGELLALHEGIAARLRAELSSCRGDSATLDFLRRLADFHETAAWMLRMVLQGPDVPTRND